MAGLIGFWELAGAASAVGGTGVWGLALAAREGLLRGLLEVFPRSMWDAVTWGLIPALMLISPVLQGAAVALMSAIRPAPVGRAVGGAVGGTLLAMGVFGGILIAGRALIQPIVATVPILGDLFTVCFGIALVAGWLVIAGQIPALGWLRWTSLPLALAAVTVVWAEAHAAAVSLVYVLDQREMNGFFASVAVGGAVGSTWTVCRSRGTRARPLAVVRAVKRAKT
ncbi:MAG TPA: hypothetical protein VFW01_00585 [bacterium]|nr:hypothetical protein [bacterium]